MYIISKEISNLEDIKILAKKEAEEAARASNAEE